MLKLPNRPKTLFTCLYGQFEDLSRKCEVSNNDPSSITENLNVDN